MKAESLASGRPLSALLLTYPVHQTADILGPDGDVVPVGRDQLPHLEPARVVARRFGSRYAPVFEEPRALLPQTLAAAIRSARTDGHLHRTYDPQTRPQVVNLLSITAAPAGTTPDVIAQDVGDAGRPA